MEYLVIAHASWTEGHEHPNGGDRDTNNTVEKSLLRRFRASSADEARVKAAKHLKAFKKSLPPLHPGSLSWVKDRTFKNVALGKVLAM